MKFFLVAYQTAHINDSNDIILEDKEIKYEMFPENQYSEAKAFASAATYWSPFFGGMFRHMPGESLRAPGVVEVTLHRELS